jgi:hypothetical protein
MFTRKALRWTLGLASLLAAAPVHAQQNEQQPAAAQPRPSRPPLVNRANDMLPPWLRIRGEFRERFEGFTNAGFTSDRDDLYWLSRFRLNATVTPGRLVSFSVQAQDARVGNKAVGPPSAPFRGTLDLRTGYADVGSSSSPVAARIGRQELVFGEQRLVGHVAWLNTARTFDAARMTVRTARFQVDVFGASVVRILDNQFDKSGNGNRFIGAYGSVGALIPRSTLEPYVFWKRDREAVSADDEPPFLVARGTARCALYGRQCGARSRRKWRRQPARGTGNRCPGIPSSHAAVTDVGRLRLRLSRKLSETGDAGCSVRLPVRHGHLRLPGGEVR